MTKDIVKKRVRDILDEYLEANNHRKTSERYAILDAVYDIELRLVVRHRFIGQTKYEACYNNEDHIHQICTLCGTVTEVDSPEIADAIKNTKFHRFRRDGFSLYIYGICSRCQAALSRQRSKFLTQKQVKNSHKSK